jgi:Cysteine-rich secretory protein family
MRTVALLLALAGAVLVLAPERAAATCAYDGLKLSTLPTDGARGVLLCSINVERAAHGLRAVVPERHLQSAAQAYGADMVARRFFAHTSPDGSTLTRRVRAAGYFRRTVRWALGEAIGWAPQSVAVAAALTQAWMDSPAHREILLDPRFREVGIGIAAGVPDLTAGPGATAVLDFGRRTMRHRVRAWRSRTACASTPRTSSRTRARCASRPTRSRR